MVLSDSQIKERLDSGDLVIDPILDLEEQLQPASFDIRNDNFIFSVVPNRLLLIETFEKVSLPNDLAAQVVGRSSMGRKGVAVHITSGWIDPGYKGKITLQIYNVSDKIVEIKGKERIAQLVFFQTGSAERPYGKERGSQYGE